MTQKKLDKFINKILTLADTLESHRREAAIQHSTNLYYYLQKKDELLLLYEATQRAIDNLKFAEDTNNPTHIENATKRLKFTETTFNTEYTEVFTRWRKDSIWLNRYLTNSPLDNWPQKAEDLKSQKLSSPTSILL